jgi:uncharacterized membrane protein
MESKAKLAGHPIHQMLIPLPLGLFVFSAVVDILYGIDVVRGLSQVTYWNIIVGVVTGLLAAVFGAVDWLAIPNDTRAKRIGAFHGLGNVVLVGSFALAAIIRSDNVGYAPSAAAVVIEAFALVLGTITAWLGGELVDRLGIGVDPDAHVNAPSSLTRRPARVTR